MYKHFLIPTDGSEIAGKGVQHGLELAKALGAEVTVLTVTALWAPLHAARGARLESPDIRAGMAMLIAAMCAEGTSTINNAQQIERGYERIDERLNALGARITRVPPRA